MKKIFLITLLLVVYTKASYAQDTQLLWADSYGADVLDSFLSTTVSENGNIYSTGYYENVSDFDPDDTVFELPEEGYAFIQKLNNEGELVWVKSLLATDIDISISPAIHGTSITTDSNENAIVVGFFTHSTDFDPGPDEFELVPNVYDVFIQKMNADGDFQWAMKIGADGPDKGLTVTTDTDNNIYVAGYFWGEVDFDPDPSNEIILISHEIADFEPVRSTFLMKIDPDGNVIWAHHIASDSIVKSAEPYDIKSDSDNNVILSGRFHGNTDFDLSEGELFINGYNDSYVAKYDTDANLLWVNPHMSSSLANKAYAIAIDDQDQIYCTGTFGGTVDFDNSGAVFEIEAQGFHDTFVQKLSPDGALIWVKQIAGSGYVNAYDIVVDQHGEHNIYFTGTFSLDADFDPGIGEHEMITEGATGQWGTNIYIEQINPEGDFIWAERIGSNDYGRPRSIATTGDAGVLISGDYSTYYDFGPTDNEFILYSEGLKDGFMAKYLFCLTESFALDESTLPALSFECETGEIVTPIAVNGCGVPYLGTPNVSFPITEAGDYTINWTYENSAGQILEQEQDISVVALDTEVNYIDNYLEAVAEGYTYQWLDCDNDNSPVIGANTQVFYPENAGNYAVEITNSNDCSEISDCINFFGLALAGNELHPDISIYPNPTQGKLYIEFSEPYEKRTVRIIDLFGFEVDRFQLTDVRNTEIAIRQAKGLYFLEIENESGILVRKKILKQ